MKLWGILKKDQKIIRDMIYEITDENLSDEEQLHLSLEAICREFDIPKPLWLNKHKNEFIRFSRTTFKAEHFMEEIRFDSFEIEVVIDKKKEK